MTPRATAFRRKGRKFTSSLAAIDIAIKSQEPSWTSKSVHPLPQEVEMTVFNTVGKVELGENWTTAFATLSRATKAVYSVYNMDFGQLTKVHER